MKIDWNNGRSKASVLGLIAYTASILYFITVGYFFAALFLSCILSYELQMLYFRSRLPKKVLEAHDKITEEWEKEA